MGNNSSHNNFTNLGKKKIKQKSIYSFNILLQNRKIKNTNSSDKYEFVNNKKCNISCKLKLYPSNLILKNDKIILKISYYEIPSWGVNKNCFYFETMDESFCCKSIESQIIADSIKSICSNIHKENQRGKLE